MREIYLDNSATTPLCESAKSAMREAMESYGNPSSLHFVGSAAHKTLEGARLTVAKTLGLSSTRDCELIFTSSGSEANNLAVLGCVAAKPNRTAKKIVTTDSEHASVEQQLCYLEKNGFEIVRVPTKGGVLDMEYLDSVLDKNVFLVTMMLVNNETGAVYDLKSVFSLAKRRNPDVICHCDAVQGYLKMRLTPASIGADMMTVSAHKIHGPKGIGALYVSPEVIKKRKLSPIIYGGGQEDGFRSGTENVIGIAGFAAAAKEGYEQLANNVRAMQRVREYAIEKLSPLEIKMNIPSGNIAPHILNITLPSIKSETMLNFLSGKGICVSGGSACSSNSKQRHISRSLLAFGLDEHDADCSIRISISEHNTEADIDELAVALSEGIESLVKIKK